jgi:hypothetical protein
MASPLICASIATCPHLAVLEHDCDRGRQALGDAAGFLRAAAGRAAPRDQRHQLLAGYLRGQRPLKSDTAGVQERITHAVIFKNGQVAMESRPTREANEHQRALILRLRRLLPNRLFYGPSSANACG